MLVVKKFVVAKKDIVLPDSNVIAKGEIGFIDLNKPDGADIFFVSIWRKIFLKTSNFQVIDVRKTGDAFRNKICNVCHKLKKTADFSRNQNGVNNRPVRRPSCKDCRVIMEGVSISRVDSVEWRQKKPNYEPFECPICRKRTIAGVTSKVVLEHDHRTGKVGGWICDSCNTGLGRFKDDIALLESAIEFLKKAY